MNHIEGNLEAGLHAMHQAKDALANAAMWLEQAIEETSGATDLARLFIYLKEGRDVYDAESKRIGKLLNFLSNSRLPDVMESEDVRMIRFEQLQRRVQVSHRQGCSIIPDTKSDAYDWLRENGHEALITETVNSSTLAAFSKDYVAEHLKDLPVDLFKTVVQPFISVVKT